MNFSLIFRTIRHLCWRQAVWQVINRVYKPRLQQMPAPKHRHCLLVEPIPRMECRVHDTFSFLNISDTFRGWNDTSHGMLWAYNLNYFDFINQRQNTTDDVNPISKSLYWIDRFIEDIAENHVGLDPYPIALRCINWVKFFCIHPECATSERENSTYSQLRLLGRKLEYHLLGNHLLEDAYSLYFCSAYFEDAVLIAKARKLLFSELREQILADGAHYEQSAMYHCILLDRLLDCYNMAVARSLAADATVLRGYAILMLGHLESIAYRNGDIPLMNDAANGIAPDVGEIFTYAKRLGLRWQAVPLAECGYRRLQNSIFETTIDIGEIVADYQPGHSHADVTNYELRIGGLPFVVDTGISTYDKTTRRQYERSGAAHNVVTVADRSCAEVWGGFRVGYRYKCREIDENTYEVIGYGDATRVVRSFKISDGKFCVTDDVHSNEVCISRIHLAPGVDITKEECGECYILIATLNAKTSVKMKIHGARAVRIIEEQASRQYNVFDAIKVVEIEFAGKLSYSLEL